MSSELQQLSEHVYYVAGGVNMALIVQEAKAIFVDTGGDKDAGRKLKKAVTELNVTPVAIINSHAHADHYGGNDFLLRQFDVPVYAPSFEAGIMQNPYLEPVYLFSGAKPLPELMNKWLLAKPSKVDHILSEGRHSIAGINLEVFNTRGHAHEQLAIKIDDVMLAADALFGASVLEKYPLPFGQDIAQQLASSQRIADLCANGSARLVLPGHGNPSEAIDALVALNLATLNKAADSVEAACSSQGSSTSEVLKSVCDSLGIEMLDLARYYLNHCVVQAYLSYLRDEGRVTLRLEHNELRWYSKS